MKLFIYTDPSDAICTLKPDDGPTIDGRAENHPGDNRPGHAFDLPGGTANGHGAQLTVSAKGKSPLTQRGILYTQSSLLQPFAMFCADDFRLSTGGRFL